MRVVITGGSGNVARYVIAEMESSHELRLFDRVSPSQGRFPFETSHPVVLGELTDLESCRHAVAGMDAIIHLGAIGHPTNDTFRINTLGTYNILEAARLEGVGRVVMASSLCATGIGFRIRGEFEPQYLPVDENHPTSGEDNYSLSKRLNEETMAAFTRAYGITTAAFRLAGVWREEMQQKHAANYPASTEGQHKWMFAYVDIRDVARAFRMATEAPKLPDHGVYFISAYDTLSLDNSQEVAAHFYPTAKRVALEGRQSLLNWKKAAQTFGWHPAHSWTEYLAK